MWNGAEAYLEMWERADGVPTPGCARRRRRADRATGCGAPAPGRRLEDAAAHAPASRSSARARGAGACAGSPTARRRRRRADARRDGRARRQHGARAQRGRRPRRDEGVAASCAARGPPAPACATASRRAAPTSGWFATAASAGCSGDPLAEPPAQGTASRRRADDVGQGDAGAPAVRPQRADGDGGRRGPLQGRSLAETTDATTNKKLLFYCALQLH